MAIINPHINFNGNEEAFTFYKSVFGGEFAKIIRFKDLASPEFRGSDWDLNFSEQGGTTKVSISIYNESLERLERMIECGFRGGVMVQMKNLEELLDTLSRSKENK